MDYDLTIIGPGLGAGVAEQAFSLRPGILVMSMVGR